MISSISAATRAQQRNSAELFKKIGDESKCYLAQVDLKSVVVTISRAGSAAADAAEFVVRKSIGAALLGSALLI